jgi:hypothetical protein
MLDRQFLITLVRFRHALCGPCQKTNSTGWEQSGVAPFRAYLLSMQRPDLFPSCGLYTGGVVMRQYEDLLIDALLDSGFNLEEAFRLIALQERYEHEHSWQRDERQLGEWIELMGGKSCLN